MNNLLQYSQEHGVLVAAHRGVAGANIPCNTIPAFEIALRSGASILEMDLFKSKDGEIFIFHTGKEPYQLGMQIDLTKMSAKEIRPLRLVNVDFNPTRHGINTFDEVLEHFKGQCILNLDRCGGFLEDVVRCVERHNMREQILLKTAPTPEMLAAVKSYAPDYMYMPIYMEKDTATETIEQKNINFVGAELVFATEQSPVAQANYIQAMRDKGLVLWGNGVLYNEKVPLAAGHSDDVSMMGDPDAGWGWLVKHGFSIIQTDWAVQCTSWLKKNCFLH